MYNHILIYILSLISIFICIFIYIFYPHFYMYFQMCFYVYFLFFIFILISCILVHNVLFNPFQFLSYTFQTRVSSKLVDAEKIFNNFRGNDVRNLKWIIKEDKFTHMHIFLNVRNNKQKKKRRKLNEKCCT